MTHLNDRTILIVDRTNSLGVNLRNAFMKTGANTHVVGSFAAAAKLLESKRIDAVLVEFSTDSDTVAFCKTLSGRSVPCIFTCEPLPRYMPARKEMLDVVTAIRNVVADHAVMTV